MRALDIFWAFNHHFGRGKPQRLSCSIQFDVVTLTVVRRASNDGDVSISMS